MPTMVTVQSEPYTIGKKEGMQYPERDNVLDSQVETKALKLLNELELIFSKIETPQAEEALQLLFKIKQLFENENMDSENIMMEKDLKEMKQEKEQDFMKRMMGEEE